MALYQTSVLKKYLNAQDKEAVSKAYKKFNRYFHNPSIQQNIRDSKEEQFQEGFLRELFVKVLGYTLNPTPKYDLTTEFKNETGAKKVDGAILKDGHAVGVIELKGTDTKDLEKIRQQAFDYKANHESCVYVITANFEKLRFYINNAVNYEEFNLFALTEERFALLYLCLAKENIDTNTPIEIKNASIREEEAITKKFYNDYSNFKRSLFRDLVKQNIKNEVFRTELNRDDTDRGNKNIKHHLFQKSQKLIDRFLFIFFAEDRGLLPPNSTMLILGNWKKLQDLDEEVPLYSRFKKYFHYLDQGRKGTDKKAEIFAYNGGLFKPDAILDSLSISDDLLYEHTKNLSHYDFESQVDVNILGHIFENSLNEIESINAEIEGTEFEKQKSKRKKDGVFYTPKYITKYIIDNTVGSLCENKKNELKLDETEYRKTRKNRHAKKLKELQEKLQKYREWLLSLTILDPACGSGAFLNQALDFLLKEHKYIDELQTALLGGSIVFPDIENTVLENNIYGVDLNEESVEIAKLSLWLRTAQPRRKLNDLSSNIKCGNSLIDNKSIAGKKAFNWHEEYPNIFKNGGFDIIIGNPPYGIFLDPEEEDFFKKNYPLTNYKINLYVLFIERVFQIFDKGLVQFIIPKSLLFNTYFEKIRKKLLENSKIHEIFMLSEKVFADAEVGGSLILKFERNNKNNNKELIKLISADKYLDYESKNCIINNLEQSFFLKIPHYEISPIIKGGNSLLKKLHGFKQIKDYYKLKNGLNPGNIKHILISDNKETENHRPIIWGKEFNKYEISWGGQYINYDSHIAETITLDDIKSKEGMKKQTKIDFALRSPELFEEEKIIVRKTGDRFIATKDTNKFYFDTLVHGIYQISDKYNLDFLLAVLNSNPATFFYRILHDIKGKVFAKISLDKLGAFPLPTNNPYLIDRLSNLSRERLRLQSSLNTISTKFERYLESQFVDIVISRKLKYWYSLTFSDFIKEINKIVKKSGIGILNKKEEMEWMDVFEENKAKAISLKEEIDIADNKIDIMVYELYGLSKEEIAIIENN